MKKSLFFALILMGVLFYPAAIADATCMPYRSIVVVNRIGSAEKLFLAQLHKFGIPPANYSGIAKVSENRFAVVSDKEDGFYLFEIKTNKEKNQIISCTRGELRNNPFFFFFTQNEQVEVPPIDSLSADSSSLNKLSVSNIPTTVKKMNIIRGRDCEGIVYVPNRGTVFISGEEDQRIIEYDTLGSPTGRELAVPDLFSRQNSSPNYGFEALAFDNLSGRFYTTTENTLPADRPVASPDNHSPTRLRIQCFGSDMQPAESYGYMTDAPVANNLYSHYAFGVPAMYALSADTLLLLEREFFVGKSLEVIKSYVVNRLFKVVLSPKYEIAQGELLHERSNELFLKKTLVYEWDTTFGAGIANYEGLCVAGVTPGGRPILYLINDSQAGYKGVLKEFILMLAL